MLQLVKIALLRPLTFVVMAILIVLFGSIAWIKTPTDIFPDIKVPVIAAVWTYNGLSPKDMSGRIIYNYERQLTATVNDIEHMESSSYNGIGVVKIYFRPGVDIRTATAQVTSTSQTVLKQMPAGITPPLILNYSASTVPILQIALSSGVLSEQQLFDLGQNTIRSSLATVQGAACRRPMVAACADPDRSRSAGAAGPPPSPADVGAALASQNQIIPAGTARIGTYEYNVNLNNAPEAIDSLNNLPIKTVDGATVTMRDVANVHDGSPPQQNEVRVNGKRSVLMTLLKAGPPRPSTSSTAPRRC
jgi:multidrug efflux pump subunit AcrB